MRRTKEQKGITLIALIITIVVLMVLASVAISTIQNDGIIGHAQNATNKFTEEQQKEQDMINYYELVLSGKAWAQNGQTVSRNGQILNVGEKVTLKVGTADAVAYSAGDYRGDWVVLGAEYGKLLLVSSTNVANVPLGGTKGGKINGTDCAGGYYNGVEALNTVCATYLDETYADSARSITVEDVNRVTGFSPVRAQFSGYGITYTITQQTIADRNVECVLPDGRKLGENGLESVSVFHENYYYNGLNYTGNDTSNPAYVTLFANTAENNGAYWLATSSVRCSK